MSDRRPQHFDAWWNTLTDDQRRQAHDSVGHEVNVHLRESFLEAEIILVEAHLSDSEGVHRPVWLMPTAVADFIAERWQDHQATAPGAEQFRLKTRRVLNEFVADHHGAEVDAAVAGFTTDNADGECEIGAHPNVHGNAAREATGIDAQSFDLPTYE